MIRSINNPLIDILLLIIYMKKLLSSDRLR